MKKKRPQSRKKGQVVVEYILVTLVLVGMGMGAYVAMRKYIAGPLGKIKKSLQGDDNPYDMGKSAGSGGKNITDYYRNVEFKSQ